MFHMFSHGVDMGPASCDQEQCTIEVTAMPVGVADVGTEWGSSEVLEFAPTPPTTAPPTTVPATATPEATISTTVVP
jgi:hypothetical protein